VNNAHNKVSKTFVFFFHSPLYFSDFFFCFFYRFFGKTLDAGWPKFQIALNLL